MIIRAIKETFGQVFHSPEATGSWEVECAIDEDVVECEEMDTVPYTAFPDGKIGTLLPVDYKL